MKSFKINPLDSGKKYYGTDIVDENGREVISIWGVNRKNKPSYRELALWTPEDQSEIMCDGHYEDAGDLEVANVIVKALNKYFKGMD